MPSPHSFPASWPFDLAVIGGGIAGSAIAREASLHGKRVILFEKNTFALDPTLPYTNISTSKYTATLSHAKPGY